MSAPSTLLLALAPDIDAAPWRDAFAEARPDLRVVTLDERPPAAAVRFAAAWRHPHGSLAPYRGLEAIFSLGAGVDHLLADPALPAGVPVARVVDPDLTTRMSEYVLMHVLLHHRQQRLYDHLQFEKIWADDALQPAAPAVRVGVMGLGVLGQDAARKLRMMGFDVAGWSARPKTLDGITTYAGPGERDAFLARTQILVVLLPLTPSTRGLIDGALLARLARDGHPGGAILINAGRGGLQKDADILQALDEGILRAATLDVFEQEPLPAASPLWHHPGVTVTPHNAAPSAPPAIARLIAAQTVAVEGGQALQHTVDRSARY